MICRKSEDENISVPDKQDLARTRANEHHASDDVSKGEFCFPSYKIASLAHGSEKEKSIRVSANVSLCVHVPLYV